MPQQRIDIQLGFQADTSQAKTQIEQLQQSLNRLTATNGKVQNNGNLLGLDPKSISEANLQIAQLQTALNNAFNTKTDKLDLSLFQSSLKQAGLSVQDLSKTFANLGPQGVETFTQLSRTIASAEAPIIRLGNGMRQFMTTLANSARYMVATRALNTMAGTIMNAFNYAKDLDKSLNNIAIVTGASADKMAEFATQANKAAQRLSVTTTGYTDAALIYYQQGLNDQEVAARTETTMKLSNVTGESAQEVSSYMTAIWNNFYDGSQSIEEFADKITALGAATASSSAEIAGGLQQFAAVANTVGLSYDYAATALATIVAQTRQSESTVGNGLRTIFSRMQGLKLDGETEDGVTLNKYSQALADVGVNALDANGELRDMDSILNDLGAKWQTLSRAQQVALAQTVGGVRQYTTLVALMENWGKFQENLSIVQGADGTLQRQQEIYERSWEASSKRVKAAAQSIYQDIIDDKFFISLNDLFAGFLKTVDQAIKGLGGVKGVLSAISAIVFTLFKGDIAQKINNLTVSLNTLYHPESIDKTRTEFFNAYRDFLKDTGTSNINSTYSTNALQTQINGQERLLELSKNLSKSNQEVAAAIQQQVDKTQELVIQETKQLQLSDERLTKNSSINSERIAINTAIKNNNGYYDTTLSGEISTDALKQAIAFGQSYQATQGLLDKIDSTMIPSRAGADFDLFKQSLQEIGQLIQDDARFSEEFKTKFSELGKVDTPEKLKQGLSELQTAIDNQFGVDANTGATSNKIFDFIMNVPAENFDKKTREWIEWLRAGLEKHGAHIGTAVDGIFSKNAGQAAMDKLKNQTADFGQKVSKFARDASSMAMQINGIRGAITALSDKDIAPWEKFIRVTSGFGMAFGPNGVGTQFIQGFGKFRTSFKENSSFENLFIGQQGNTINDWQKQGYFDTTFFNDNYQREIFKKAGKSLGLTDNQLGGWNSFQSNKQMNSWLSNPALSEDLKNQIKLSQQISNLTDENKQKFFQLAKNYNTALQAGDTKTLKNLAGEFEKLGFNVGNASGKLGVFGSALKSAFAGLATQVAIMAALAATVWLVQKAYEAWYATTEKGQIEQYNNKIENLTNAIDNLKTSAEDAASSIEKVNEATKQIRSIDNAVGNTLKDGSLELTNQILEANQNLRDVLDEAGLWDNEFAKITIDEKGLYHLENAQEVQQELLRQQEESYKKAEYLEYQRKKTLQEQNAVMAAYEAGDASFVDYKVEYNEKGDVSYSNLQNNADLNKDFVSTVKSLMNATDSLSKDVDFQRKFGEVTGLQDLQSVINKALESGDQDKLRNTLEALGLDSIVEKLFNQDNAAELWDKIFAVETAVREMGTTDAEEISQARAFLKEAGIEYDPTKLTAERARKINEFAEEGSENLTTEQRAEILKEADIITTANASDFLEKVSNPNFNATNFISNNQAPSSRRAFVEMWANSKGLKETDTGWMVDGKAMTVDEILADSSMVYKIGEDWEQVLSYYYRQGYAAKLKKTDSTFGLSPDEFNDLRVTEEKKPLSSKDWVEGTHIQANEMLNLNGEDPEAKKALDIFNNQIQEEVENLRQLEEYASYSDEALEVLALDTAMASDAFEELSQNAESWFKKIEKGGSSGAKALQSLSDCLLKVTGLADDFANAGIDIDKEFADYLDRNLETAKAAANGDLDAIKELHNAAGRLAFDKIAGNKVEGISEEDRQALIGEFTTLQEDIQAELDKGIKIGSEVTVDPKFYDRLNAIVSSSASTIEQANAILGSLNLDAGDFDLVEETMPASNKFSLKVDGKEIFSGEYEASATIYHPVPKGSAQAYAQSKAKENGGYAAGKHTSATDVAKFNEGLSNIQAMGGASLEQQQQAINTLAKKYGMVQHDADYWMDNLFVNGSMSEDYAKYLADNYGDKISFTDPSAPGGLSGGGGYGSGGGGGSGSGGKDREKKAYEDEIERYHYLLKTIDAVNKKYDELENAREKAYGTDEIEIMDKEIENLEQQIALQKTYLDAISQDYVSDRAAIAAYGAQFDENGNIINYEEIYRRQIDLVNSAAGDDEAADKAYEKFQKVLEQYEKTNELLQDTKLSYQELLDKVAELNLEKITVSVDYNVAISDRDRKYLEWLADNMGDSIDKTADKIANLSKQMETYVRDAQTYGEGINAILEQVGEAGLLEKIINQELTDEQFKELGLTTQQIKQIEDYKDKLMETQQAERELAKTAVEEVTTAFSDWNEEVSNSIDRINSLNDSLEKYRDIIGLLDEDIIGSTKALNDEIDAAERQNNLKAIEGQQRKYEQAQQNLERLNALYQDAQDKNNQVAIDALKDSVKEAEEAVIQAHQDMLEATSEALSDLESQWEASMERISKEFAKNMTGLNDISYFKDIYDRQKEMSDWYLDDYEKYYNLNKLVTQINKDLGDNSSLVVSSKLNGLLGKINGSLAEGAQISEATVGYYQKELELIEAQMALEAARNAKSVVRMVRDNEGNMSYVYTADSNAIESAEENYQEKWYNLMQYTTEQQDELQEKMISSMEDFIDRAVEAAEKFGIGTEAFNRELGNIQQDFTDLFDYLAGEMDNADGMFSHLQNNWWKELEEGLQKTVALEPDFKTSFGKTVLGQLLGTEDTEDWVNLMNSGTNKALSQIYNNGQTYIQNQDEILQAANSSLDSVISDTSVGVSENQEMADEEMKKLDKTLTDGEKVLGDAADSLKAFGDKWNGQMSAMTATTDALVNSLNNYFNTLSKINDISSSINPFDFSTMVSSFEQELTEMEDISPSQLDLSGISSQLVSAPSMVSDISASGLTSLLSLVPSGELDQNVQINATFPNVVNHREIELALNNLILSASQYANRK